MQGDAPGIAQHQQFISGRVGGEIVGDGCAGGQQAVAIRLEIFRNKRQVKLRRMAGGIIRRRGQGALVDFDQDGAGGEETDEGGGAARARHHAAEMLDIPVGQGGGIGNLQGTMFKSHGLILNPGLMPRQLEVVLNSPRSLKPAECRWT